jgi:CBS domain-containing protein
MDATEKMNEHKIGSLIVMDGNRVAGIFTERDVLSRIVVAQRDPTSTQVGEVMTREVLCCRMDMDLDEVGAMMKTHRCRHLPVCDDAGRLEGMISIGDINAYYTSNQAMQIEYLSEYIYGRV